LIPSSCRFCGSALEHAFCDLGLSPLSNAFVAPARARGPDVFFPLQAYVCSDCLLVQLDQFETPEKIFNNYVYFSSFSDSWLAHCRDYVDQIVPALGLNECSRVVELASNDGYLLQYFKERGIPTTGIEPARNVADTAIARGIETICAFFGESLARTLAADGLQADLIVANNVLAHVPDLNDFVAGIGHILKPGGILTVEFPHLLTLIQQNQFDTIYHEHFSYFSLRTCMRVFAAHGLRVHHVDVLSTHGGSLRVHASPAAGERPADSSVADVLNAEQRASLDRLEGYLTFQGQVDRIKRDLLTFLIDAANRGKSVVGYGAPAKGNTLLNYCGIKRDLLDYVVDRSPHKQGLLLPGTRIPVHAPARIHETRPDYLLILPWNLRDEVTTQMAVVRQWGGKFVVPIPEVTVLE